MAKIELKIKTCRECPFFREERMYTADSWEMAFDWFCDKKDGKKIRGYVETFDKVKIPKWCPIKTKKK